MRKSFLLTVLLIVFFSPALGEVFYQIDADRSSVDMNTTLELECSAGTGSCPVNRWRLAWDIPNNAEIISIRDSIAEIEDYTMEGSQVSLKTNSGSQRTTETVKIQLEIDESAEEIHKGLYKRKLDLAGFSGEKTSGIISNPDIISGWMGRRFTTSYTDNNMSFTGTGSTSLRINFGKGNKTKYYTFFGGNPDNTSLAYEVSVGMTGLKQGFERFPVALMNPDNYEDSVVGWSAGEYVGGSFRMRKNLEDDFLPVLAHETVHGLNERELKWDDSSSTWLDEGTAKYIESMVNLHLKGKERTRNLFGEDTTYTEKRNGTRYKITAPSSGDPQMLWSYYQEDRDFMKEWNPHNFPDERSFGYAYSELIIRNYVVNQNRSLRELYQKINPQREVTSNQEKWDLVSKHLDLTPCKYDSRGRFDRCLERINQHDYQIYRAENISKSENRITVTPLEIKEREKKKSPLDLIKGSKDGNNTKNGNKKTRVSKEYKKYVKILADFFKILVDTGDRLAGDLNYRN